MDTMPPTPNTFMLTAGIQVGKFIGRISVIMPDIQQGEMCFAASLKDVHVGTLFEDMIDGLSLGPITTMLNKVSVELVSIYYSLSPTFITFGGVKCTGLGFGLDVKGLKFGSAFEMDIKVKLSKSELQIKGEVYPFKLGPVSFEGFKPGSNAIVEVKVDTQKPKSGFLMKVSGSVAFLGVNCHMQLLIKTANITQEKATLLRESSAISGYEALETVGGHGGAVTGAPAPKFYSDARLEAAQAEVKSLKSQVSELNNKVATGDKGGRGLCSGCTEIIVKLDLNLMIVRIDIDMEVVGDLNAGKLDRISFKGDIKNSDPGGVAAIVKNAVAGLKKAAENLVEERREDIRRKAALRTEEQSMSTATVRRLLASSDHHEHNGNELAESFIGDGRRRRRTHNIGSKKHGEECEQNNDCASKFCDGNWNGVKTGNCNDGPRTGLLKHLKSVNAVADDTVGTVKKTVSKGEAAVENEVASVEKEAMSFMHKLLDFELIEFHISGEVSLDGGQDKVQFSLKTIFCGKPTDFNFTISMPFHPTKMLGGLASTLEGAIPGCM